MAENSGLEIVSDAASGDGGVATSIGKSFDMARDITKGVGKTAALWAAALVVVWVSSLEPTWRTIAKSTRTFREINLSRQEAETRAVARLRRIATDEEELRRLDKFARNYPAGLKRDQERRRLEKEFKEAEGRLALVEQASGRKSAHYEEAETKKARADQKLRQFRSDEAKFEDVPVRKARLESVRAELAKEPEHIKYVYAEARKQALANERNVSFDLFGLKFNAPTLVAPLLWCLLASALFGYLSRVRAKALSSYEQGVQALARLPHVSEEVVQELAERLPAWTVGSASFASTSGSGLGTGGAADVRQRLMDRVFRASAERSAVASIAFLLPFLILAVQFRVGWIALELSRHVGSNFARSLVPAALVACISSAFWTAEQWFSTRWDGPASDRRTLFRSLVAAFVLVEIASTLHPRFAIHFGQLFQQSLIRVAELLSLLLVGLAACRFYTGGTPDPESGSSRRRIIITMTGLAALAMVVPFAFPLFRKVACQVAERRRTRNRKTPSMALEQGFYQKKAFREEGISNRSRRRASEVIHYVGVNGRISGRGGFPSQKQISRMTKPPIVNLYSFGLLRSLGLTEALQVAPIGALSPLRTTVRLEIQPRDGAVNDSPALSTDPPLPDIPPSPHVNLSAASWSFEQAALAVLSPISNRASAHACELLLTGIHHDLIYKQRMNKQRKKDRPNFRLYDLMAGVCIRYGQRRYLQQLLELIELSDQRLVFQTRVEKWQNPTSSWWKKWRNRSKPVSWDGNSHAVVFQ